MVLLDEGVDLAVVRTDSSDDLDRLETDGRLELLRTLYRRFPNLSIDTKRLRAPLDDFGELVSAMQELTKAAHQLSE